MDLELIPGQTWETPDCVVEILEAKGKEPVLYSICDESGRKNFCVLPYTAVVKALVLGDYMLAQPKASPCTHAWIDSGGKSRWCKHCDQGQRFINLTWSNI